MKNNQANSKYYLVSSWYKSDWFLFSSMCLSQLVCGHKNSLDHPCSRLVCPILSPPSRSHSWNCQVLKRAEKSSSQTILVWFCRLLRSLLPSLHAICEYLCKYFVAITKQLAILIHTVLLRTVSKMIARRSKVYWMQYHLPDSFLNTHYNTTVKIFNTVMCICACCAWFYEWWQKTIEVVTKNKSIKMYHGNSQIKLTE